MAHPNSISTQPYLSMTLRALVCLIISLVLCKPLYGQVGIGTSVPHLSTVLHVETTGSPKKGMLLPRVSYADRVGMTSNPTPAIGLTVYDSDLDKYFIIVDSNSTLAWAELDHDWIRKDNGSTKGNDLFSGTSGNVGIGTSNPASKLSVTDGLAVGSPNFIQTNTAPQNGMIVDSALGIGTGSITSGYKLEVNGRVKFNDEMHMEGSSQIFLSNNQDTVTIGTDGVISTTNDIYANGFIGKGSVPSGMIAMYFSNVPPPGWALCNGAPATINNTVMNTPDLRNRFVVGAGASYNYGSTGGTNAVTLTTAQMPNHDHNWNDPGHSHTVTICGDGGTSGQNLDRGGGSSTQPCSNTNYNYVSTTETSNITFNNEGGGLPHENRPPYYGLFYIIKIDN